MALSALHALDARFRSLLLPPGLPEAAPLPPRPPLGAALAPPPAVDANGCFELVKQPHSDVLTGLWGNQTTKIWYQHNSCPVRCMYHGTHTVVKGPEQ